MAQSGNPSAELFDHVTIRVSDRPGSERFYATVLRTLGIEQSAGQDALAEWDDFSIAPAGAERPVTRGLHIGFAAPSRAHVDAFWRAGVDAGYRDDGAPGPRPQYAPDYYGGFLLDPDGNSAEAVNGGVLPGGHIDHLWIRVGDVAAARRFYVAVAPFTGFRLNNDRTELAQFRAGDGTSFSVVAGNPTEHVHLAFGAGDDATVEAFHRAATGAGYRDNGDPGERAVYHAGYYGAYVLDPDGNNVEVVNHNR
jgi:catechol 2,3-dioxygenase-like lactoylglutathione lyase family enzyme